VAYHRLLAGGQDASTAWSAVVEQQPAAGVFCYYGSDWSAGSPRQMKRAGSANSAS
jgi:hypothetical protein